MTTLHPDIERVALLGWYLYPASNRSRAACFEGATDAATCDLDQLERWNAEYPTANWRVVFGPSGLWGIDLDRPPLHAHDGVAAFAELVRERGLPPRPTMRSGGGGLAVFFRHDGEPIIGKAGHPAAGCDPRRGRQSQTIPPSVHHVTGRPYAWAVAPWDVPAPAAPAWLLRLVEPPPAPSMRAVPREPPTADKARNYAIAALHAAIRRVATSGDGTRNNTLNEEAFGLSRFLRDGSLIEEEVRDSLYHAATTAGLLARDALATIQSGMRAGRRA